MSKKKPATVVTPAAPAVVEPVEDSATEAAAGNEPTPTDAVALFVYSVTIPNCLLGEQFVLAESPEEATAKYKAPSGITRHGSPAQVYLTDLDPTNLPEGVSLYGDT